MRAWARRRSWPIAAVAAVLTLLGAAVAVAGPALVGSAPEGSVGPKYSITANGRLLSPAGRMTSVGDFPTGGALSPDGRFYWVIDSGHGQDAVEIVRVSSGKVIQTLALPGGYGGVAFAPDGTRAYVSGEPKGNIAPLGPTRADDGDAIHTYDVNVDNGRATEGDPIQLPHLAPGNTQSKATTNDWPEGLAVSPDGRTLVVALNQVDQAAIVDLRSGAIRTVKVGAFPSWAAIDPQGDSAYVTNEYDGTVSKIDLAGATVTDTIAVGGPASPDGNPNVNLNAHPESLTIDPSGEHVYVPVANRDLVATIDTSDDSVSYTSVQRGEQLGAEPVAVALSPDGERLYVADENEDDVAVVSTGERKVIGRVATAAFPTAVAVTPGRQLVWLAGKGLGSGPNPGYAQKYLGSGPTPYGSFVLDTLLGRVGVLDEPRGQALVHDTQAADAQSVPANSDEQAPADTPLRPDGPIKHIFYVVRENRTYDQVLGTEGPRAEGDPSLEVFDDNGVSGPTGGITPNAHALARQFPLLDHLYADSEVSKDGHKITAGGIAPDMTQRYQQPNYSGRGRQLNNQSPVFSPPRDYIFDQAIRQSITFRNYGEPAAGTMTDDGRPTFAASKAGKDPAFSDTAGCTRVPVNAKNCNFDHGTIGSGPGQTAPNSRFDVFESEFEEQLKTDSVPALNYLALRNDHTNGTNPGFPTPQALVADNDYGLGQLVQLISHSRIWDSSAIFVVEDDSQDGADHIDAHRMPAYVISPYARHHVVVPTRYDQDSVLRSIEMILGLKPLSYDDATATPMYDAFTSQPDMSTYTAIAPEYPLDATNSANAPDAELSKAMPWTTTDAVPQSVADKILWQSVHGADSAPPPPGPNASEEEEARAVTALSAYRYGRDVGRALQRSGTYVDGRG